MKFGFGDDILRQMYMNLRFSGGYSRDIVKAFRKRMQYIESADDERDFYAMKGLRYEKLKGKRMGEHSMRLNDQYRLILRIRAGSGGNTVVVLSIEDYHK